MTRSARRDTGGSSEWLLTLLPTFPLLLLVLRLWYLSRQDLQTMLVLVQNVSPLGMIATLLITLVWTLPVVVLGGRILGSLLVLSDPALPPGETAPEESEPGRSWLVRAGERIPDWVVAMSVVLAALTWQMQFLPTLVMLALAILGLTLRQRHPERIRLVRTLCIGLPVAVAVLEYIWLAPGITSALSGGQLVTALLLMLPPALTALLTGPISARAARPLIHGVAVAALLAGPLGMGAIFLRAPILPTTAIEMTADPSAGQVAEVVIGQVVSVDDHMTSILDQQGDLRYLLNQDIQTRVLCPGDEQIPSIPVSVHGWQVEQPALRWIAPRRPPAAIDQRCQGRPRNHG